MSFKVVLPTDQNSVTVNGLYQWDYGQVLEIESVDIGSEIAEVHFACENMSEAIVRSCSFSNGVGTVTIPDQCLEQSSPVYAWIYRISGTAGHTWKPIVLPITPRTRPSIAREIPQDIADKYTELITEVNEAVENLESGNITADKAKNATNATYATSAGNAASASHAMSADTATYASGARTSSNYDYTVDGDKNGQLFSFSNVTGFGLRGEEDQGHFKLWSIPNSQGDYVCCLVPSKDLSMMLGASHRKFDRIYANEFIGKVDKAKTAKRASLATYADLITPELPLGYINVSEYEITDPAIYLVILGDGNARYSDIIFIPEWVLKAEVDIEQKEITANYVKFTYDFMSGVGVLTPHNGAGNIRRVIRLSGYLTEAVG